jgi:hypothetical protein
MYRMFRHLFNDDWYCKGCNMRIFASKSKCLKCNMDRNGNKLAPVRRFGDWNCPTCNELVFASKDTCRRCGTNKSVLFTAQEAPQVSETCVICLEYPRTMILNHGSDSHFACCEICSQIVKNRDNKCPICRKNIDSITKFYNA